MKNLWRHYASLESDEFQKHPTADLYMRRPDNR